MVAYRVLAVDDSATVRAVIARTLKLAGVDVSRFDEASGGEEALGMLRESGYDLVFCDLNMPGMTGFELVDVLLRDGLLDSVAVVIISSLGDGAAIEELRGKGVKGYLRKPLRPESLLKVVNHVMGVSHGPTV
jgi:two-component system chemotaxis response regulator CheY